MKLIDLVNEYDFFVQVSKNVTKGNIHKVKKVQKQCTVQTNCYKISFITILMWKLIICKIYYFILKTQTFPNLITFNTGY